MSRDLVLLQGNYLTVGLGGSVGSPEASGSSLEDIGAVAALARDRRRLVVHLHGGLIPESAGVAIAHKMAPVYEAAGSHSVVIVWESGLLKTVSDNVSEVVSSRLFQKLLVTVLRLVLPHFDPAPGTKGVAATPGAAEVEAELATSLPFDAWDSPVISSGAKMAGTPSEGLLQMQAQMLLQGELPLDPTKDVSPKMDVSKVADHTRDTGAKGAIIWANAAILSARVATRVVRRLLGKHGHGLYPSVLEELLRELLLADFGAAVWTAMKTKAEAMFSPNGMILRTGSCLVARLAEIQRQMPELVVDVVGHSAGSIATASMLARAEVDGLRVRKVVFLAPAIRLDVFAGEVLARHARRVFAHFRCYTMADHFEKLDHLAGKLYPRSLLYFISGVLEDDDGDTPILGLERHIAGGPPNLGGVYDEVRTFLTEPRQDRLVLSKTPDRPDIARDLQSKAVHHGDFDDEPVTQSALIGYLAQHALGEDV